MMRQFLLLLIVFVLGGCVSGSDFSALQSKVINLNAKVTSMQTRLSGLEEELGTVKRQRIVRLPTGAPTEIRERIESSRGIIEAEPNHLEAIIQVYRQGDAEGAIQQLNEFIRAQPPANMRNKALFYLGQANYSLRRYDVAEQALETLIYQGGENPSSTALNLLGRVYQAQGKMDKMKSLTDFIQRLANHSPITD